MKRIIALAFIFMGSAHAEFLWSPAYDSVNEAAVAALEEVAYQVSQDEKPVEYLGLIYEINEKFYFTVPQTSGRKHDVKQEILWPASATLAGSYHNHNSGEGNDEFSTTDIKYAKKLGVPVYMSIADNDNELRVFISGETEVHKRYGWKRPQSVGDPVYVPTRVAAE